MTLYNWLLKRTNNHNVTTHICIDTLVSDTQFHLIKKVKMTNQL